jgi:hypothetical protein
VGRQALAQPAADNVIVSPRVFVDAWEAGHVACAGAAKRTGEEKWPDGAAELAIADMRPGVEHPGAQERERVASSVVV